MKWRCQIALKFANRDQEQPGSSVARTCEQKSLRSHAQNMNIQSVMWYLKTMDKARRDLLTRAPSKSFEGVLGVRGGLVLVRG